MKQRTGSTQTTRRGEHQVAARVKGCPWEKQLAAIRLAGEQAYMNGRPLGECPYKSHRTHSFWIRGGSLNDHRRRVWREGWCAAQSRFWRKMEEDKQSRPAASMEKREAILEQL